MIELKDSNAEDLVIQEGESANIVATFHFRAETFDKDALLSLTATLYDYESGEVINSRSSQNVLDVNGGLVSEEGELSLSLDENDNLIVDTSLERGGNEQHVIRLSWTWNDGASTRRGLSEFSFWVEKLTEPI